MGSNCHSESGCALCAIADETSGAMDATTPPIDKVEDQVCGSKKENSTCQSCQERDPQLVAGAPSDNGRHNVAENHVATHRAHRQSSCNSHPGACAANCARNNCTGRHDHQHEKGHCHEHVTSSDVAARTTCCGAHGHSHAHNGVHATEVAGSVSEEPAGSKKTSADTKDPEIGEHVALIVIGMDCSSCVDEVEKLLQNIPGVSHVQVSFMMAKAEFRLDTETSSVDDVIHRVERATRFHCVQASGKQFLDLCVPSSALEGLREKNIPGVPEVARIDKNTARLFYDPVVIGARTLQERVGDLSQGLAPLQQDEVIQQGRRYLYQKLFRMAIATMFTVPVCVLAFRKDPVPGKTKIIVEFILATVVQAIAIPEFYIPAITTLCRNRAVGMDMLVSISITAAYICSVVAFGYHMCGIILENSEMFEASSMLITLILVGRFVAAWTRMRALKTVSLHSLQPAFAIIIENGQDKQIDSRLLQFGDRLRILPYTRVPTDGVVLSGHSELDESMLTGESLPVLKDPGMTVIAGTMNGSGVLEVQLTRLPGDNTVTDIAELVAKASNSKPRVQDLADLVASYFVWVVLAIAAIVFVIWMVVELKVRHSSRRNATASAITYAVAVLAISCPCSLGLAVPLVLAITGMIAGSGGVIIKSAECFERCRRITDVIFDKTGTLTESDLEVVTYETFGEDADQALAITKALLKGREHPVSVAVARYLAAKGVEPGFIIKTELIEGAGIQGVFQGTEVKAGSPAWTQSANHPCIEKAVGDGFTVLSITRGGHLVAEFSLTAKIRSNAISIIEDLNKRGISVHLVSGDQKLAVEAVASQVGIPPENVASQMTPKQKDSYVSSLMERGKIVLFCGDGANDAIAIGKADVGVQLGGTPSSSVTAKNAADVILMTGLGGIPYLLSVSHQAMYRVWINFAWAGLYNIMAILLTAGAIVVWRIEPAYAGVGEAISVLPVCFVAMTMLFHKPRQVDPERRGWRSRWPFRYIWGSVKKPTDSIC